MLHSRTLLFTCFIYSSSNLQIYKVNQPWDESTWLENRRELGLTRQFLPGDKENQYRRCSFTSVLLGRRRRCTGRGEGVGGESRDEEAGRMMSTHWGAAVHPGAGETPPRQGCIHVAVRSVSLCPWLLLEVMYFPQ